MEYKVAIVTASPNKNGLTASCGEAAKRGAESAGATVDLIDLNDHNVARCQVCDTGYGICRTEHRCIIEDDFPALKERLTEADAYVVVSPVYWGELSEPAKAFLDRLRRCEATAREESRLAGKLCMGVAAAGGSGAGTITCLFSLQQFFNQVRSDIFDLFSVTRKSREHKLRAIESGTARMVEHLKKTP